LKAYADFFQLHRRGRGPGRRALRLGVLGGSRPALFYRKLRLGNLFRKGLAKRGAAEESTFRELSQKSEEAKKSRDLQPVLSPRRQPGQSIDYTTKKTYLD